MIISRPLRFFASQAGEPIHFSVGHHFLESGAQMQRQINSLQKPIKIKSDNKKSDKNRREPRKQSEQSQRPPSQRAGENLKNAVQSPFFRIGQIGRFPRL